MATGMAAEEAVRLLRRMVELAPETDHDPLWAREPWDEGFTHASPAEQALYREAAVLLATSRDRRCPTYTWDLLTHSGVEADQLARLVRLYLTHPQSGAVRILSAHPDHLTDADLDELARVFVADVGRHLWLAGALLSHRPSGPAWDALAGFLTTVEDPWQVRTVCALLATVDSRLSRLEPDDERRRAYRRICAFVKIMSGRPRALLAPALSYGLDEAPRGGPNLLECDGGPRCHTCVEPVS